MGSEKIFIRASRFFFELMIRYHISVDQCYERIRFVAFFLCPEGSKVRVSELLRYEKETIASTASEYPLAIFPIFRSLARK